MTLIAGIDEAGRGPLAGPVFAAAVILNPKLKIDGLRDSKKLSAKHRVSLEYKIKSQALAYGIASASVEEIDQLNILQASLLAMRRAASMLESKIQSNDLVYVVDGNQDPGLDRQTSCIVGGDDRVPEIAAASILAKTSRDAWMLEAALQFPGYGFEKHKGYATVAHRRAIALLGPCSLHRKSFSWK